MKRYCFLVFACGWILMQPPPKMPIGTRIQFWLFENFPSVFANDPSRITKLIPEEGFPPNIQARTSKWLQVAAFDSAELCEKGKRYSISSVTLPTTPAANMGRFMNQLSTASNS